jgi:hypothetical protein
LISVLERVKEEVKVKTTAGAAGPTEEETGI